MTGWDTEVWRDLDAAVTRLLEQNKQTHDKAERERKDRAAKQRNKRLSSRYFGPHARYVTRQRKTRGGL